MRLALLAAAILSVAATAAAQSHGPAAAAHAAAPAETGHAANFSWTVTNRGVGDSVTDFWVDSLWGSLDAVVGNNDDFLVGNVAHSGVLAADGSYDVAITPVLSYALTGQTRFYVRTDTGNAVTESDDANNVSTVATTAVLREVADLQVHDLAFTPVAGNAHLFDVHFVVRNDGVAATNANFWYDSIYLSTDATLGDSDTRVDARRHANPLAPGEQYTVDARITVHERSD